MTVTGSCGCSVGVAGLHACMTNIKTNKTMFIFFRSINFPLKNMTATSQEMAATQILQFAIAIDARADDGETVIPELALGNVDAETLCKFCGGLFTGGGKQAPVIIHE